MHRLSPCLLLLLASCDKDPHATWHTVDAGPFSLTLPPDVREVSTQGVDSDVHQFEGPTMKMLSDYGRWSNSLSDEKHAQVEEASVDGRPARIASRTNTTDAEFPFSTAIAFRNLAPNTHLTINANCKTPADCRIAREVFLSIRFHPEK